MPRFYFHYQDGGHHRPDPEGMILPDAEAAWYQAVRSAREIIDRDMVTGALRPGRSVEIEDETGFRIDAVCFDELSAVAI